MLWRTIKESPAEFFSLLQGGFKEYHERGQLDSEPVLLKFFEQIGIDNTREQSALARLFTASVDLKSILESGQSAYEINIALQNEYNKAIDTFDGDVIRAGNSWSAMMDTIGTPFNERLRPMVKFFGNMFQGVRGNLKLLTDPRASQRFRNAPEDQQTIQDRLDRWNALSARFRTVLDKFFEPFVNFTAVRNAANTAEEFGNSIAHLAERMTPFGQKLIKGFGSITKTIADNPKLLEFGIRFTGIALAFTLIGGAVLSFLALLSGPAGILAIFGLLVTGAFALKGTFSDTSELFKKTAEEMSGLELVIKSVLDLIPDSKPAEEPKKDLIGEGYTEHKTKMRTDLSERMNDPDTSVFWKALEIGTFALNSTVLGMAEPVAQLAHNLGLPTYVPGQVMGPEDAETAAAAQRQGLNQLGTTGTLLALATSGILESSGLSLPGNQTPFITHANADTATKVDMLSDDYDFYKTDAKVEGDTDYDSSKIGLSDLVDPDLDPVSFDVTPVADDVAIPKTIIPVDTASLVDTVVQLASLNDPTVVGSDVGTDISTVLGPVLSPTELDNKPVDPYSFDLTKVTDDESGTDLISEPVPLPVPFFTLPMGSESDDKPVDPYSYPTPEPVQLPVITFPTAVQPDATFHDDKPTYSCHRTDWG